MQSVGANAAPPRNYYGPMSGGAGYKDSPTKDGYWKIEGATQGGNGLAVDVAIYRAAEMAQAAGSRFVEIHDAYSSRNGLRDERATLFARPAAAALHPSLCRSGKPGRCYTADVALVMRKLSGASGYEPGVAAPTYTDKYGRTVTESGFGVGSISAPIARK
ncbi:hypothetical protein MGWOODY_Smn1881 [hydrothermal vent metagenome]|uniref:Uncharacterized protein n=1 Tax=hydrothermal vent metagenome TaxID=652676 RepID=A0A160TNH3_9ZZZZ